MGRERETEEMTGRRRNSAWVPALLLVVVLGSWYLFVSRDLSPPPVLPQPPAVQVVDAEVVQRQRQQFFDGEVEPLLREAEAANLAAADGVGAWLGVLT